MLHCNAEPARSKQLDKVVAAADDIIAQVNVASMYYF
jgi:hypothetical protein